jgi:hypothetical protein
VGINTENYEADNFGMRLAGFIKGLKGVSGKVFLSYPPHNIGKIYSTYSIMCLRCHSRKRSASGHPSDSPRRESFVKAIGKIPDKPE